MSVVGVYGPPGIGDKKHIFWQLLADAGLPVDRVDCTTTAAPGLGVWPWTIVSGDDALAEFRPDLQVGKCHGRPILVSHEFVTDIVLFPVLHFDSYRRNVNWRMELIEDIRFLKHLAVLAKRGDNWIGQTPETCVHCRDELYAIDGQNVVYCQAHWERHR